MQKFLWGLPILLLLFSGVVIFRPQWLTIIPPDILMWSMLALVGLASIASLAHAIRIGPIAALFAVVGSLGIFLVVQIIKHPEDVLALNNGTPVLSYSMAAIALLGAGIFVYSLTRSPKNKSNRH